MTEFLPPADPTRVALQTEVVRVTVLEDRALVRRTGRISLPPGPHRLAVFGVSPILQDVSLQADLSDGNGAVIDVQAERAWRILAEDRPDDIAALEQRIVDEYRGLLRLEEERAAHRHRYRRVRTMIAQAGQEIPVDAAWGRVDPKTWQSTYAALFDRARAASEADLVGFHRQEDLYAGLMNLIRQRAAQDRLDTELVGWLGLDVRLDGEGDELRTVELAVEYIVPNALWRPVHSARWAGEDRVEFTTSAALWQNTGEDWGNAELHFSTSRMSLGHEPPRLVDDPLTVERKDEQLRVEVRAVEVEQAAVEGAAGAASDGAPPASVDNAVSLPGVDDGGQRRHLIAPGRHRVPADGRPVRVPLASAVAEGQGELIAMPEEKMAAVWRVWGRYTADEPMLAGPVELVRAHGPVGWTETRFVAAGAPFELGFGPDDAIRVERTVDRETLDRRRDEWPATRRTVRVFVSNLDDTPRPIRLVERIPVSEIEEVRITLESDATSEGYTVDDDGFVTWRLQLEGRDQREVALRWVMETAPGLEWSMEG